MTRSNDMIEGPFDVQEAKRMPNGSVHVRVAFSSVSNAPDAGKKDGLCVFVFDIEDPTHELDVNSADPSAVTKETAKVALSRVRAIVDEMSDNLILLEPS